MMPTYYQSFDTGETKTLDAWSQGYVLYTQADGSMVSTPSILMVFLHLLSTRRYTTGRSRWS